MAPPLPSSNRLAIHKAAFRGNLPRLTSLLEEDPQIINARDLKGATPLHHAAFKGHLDCVKFLVEKGCEIDSLDNDRCSPLHNAAFTGMTHCVIFLIEHGANVDHRDIDSATPLHKAVFNGHLECSKMLVENGCDINKCDNEGISPIQKATYGNHHHCVAYLLEKGALINSRDKKGSAILHKAAFNGNEEIVRLLIKKEIDVNMKDSEFATPLHGAVYNGHTQIVSLLLESGAKVNCETAKYKSTPLHLAAFNGYLDCIKLLVQYGSNINARDAKLMTSFHYTVKREHEDCAEYLISKGADIEAKDYKKRTWRDMTTSPNMIALCKGEKLSLPEPKRVQKRTMSNKKISQSKIDEEEELEIYRRLDKHGFVLQEGKENTISEKDNAVLEVHRAMKWSDMIAKWDRFYRRHPGKVKSRVEKGIPPRVRGAAWKLLCRSTSQQLLERNQVKYQDLISEDSDHIKQISRDIDRTFPSNILLMKEQGKSALFNVLKAFAAFNKEVGYCQGMGFVTATLLMYMSEEDAFWILVQLTREYRFNILWDKSLQLKKIFWEFETLLEIYHPRILQHLKSQDIMTDMYATQWFLTLYLYNLPFEVALKVWDIFFFEGFHFLYAVGLALFKIFEAKILSLGMEELFEFFKFKQKETPVELGRLTKVANGFKEKVKRSLRSLQSKNQQKLLKNKPISAKMLVG